MDEALKERAEILKAHLGYIIDQDYEAKKPLIKDMLLHIALKDHPERINKTESFKIEFSKTIERFLPGISILEEENEMEEMCPLSQAPIRIKWKAICGHVFDEETIVGFMRSSTKCPVVGCGETLRKSD